MLRKADQLLVFRCVRVQREYIAANFHLLRSHHPRCSIGRRRRSSRAHTRIHFRLHQHRPNTLRRRTRVYTAMAGRRRRYPREIAQRLSKGKKQKRIYVGRNLFRIEGVKGIYAKVKIKGTTYNPPLGTEDPEEARERFEQW